MSHKIIYWNEPFFYAIGNTSAACLTQELPPEEPGKVLLLGCGDPRSILFTIYSAKESFDYDFTCCDIEARILDKSEVRNEKVWNIFYHITLDQASLVLLLEQCERLLEVSADIETWNGSGYASFIRMCSRRTLSTLRGHWETYIKYGRLSGPEGKRYLDRFTKAWKGTQEKVSRVDLSPALAAGPLLPESIRTVPDMMSRYWRTGTTSADPKVVAATTIPNPTLSFSLTGKLLALHYGSNPILGYHIAPAFTPLKSGPKLSGKKVDPSQVVKVAREQFFEWAKCFKDALGNEKCKLVIRMFSGDAMAFCKALNYCRIHKSVQTGYHTAPWTSSQLCLDGGDYDEKAASQAPMMFNAIDTSNLNEHLGLLNLLLITTPLLLRSPMSSLYTETVLQMSAEPIGDFVKRMCGDIPAVSLLFDLTPGPYLTNVNDRSDTHEVVISGVPDSSGGLFHERLTWKIPSLSDPLVVKSDILQAKALRYSPKRLARLIFGIYHKMFEPDERMMDVNLIHFTRGTLVILLRLVKDRVETDWESFMDEFIALVMHDGKLILGLSNYQEMAAQLHIMGVYTFEVIRDYRELRPAVTPNQGVFRGWEDIPPVVCIVLSVPRAALCTLTEMGERFGTPFLHCETWSVAGQNFYTCFHPVFGEIRKRGGGVFLNEAPDGWSGSAPLVVSFWVPSWTLMVHPNNTFVAFGTTPMSIPSVGALELLSLTGKWMRMYETNITAGNVFVLRERPTISSELEKVRMISFRREPYVQPANRLANISSVHVNLDESGGGVDTLMIRGDLISEVAKKKLASGAVVKVTQASPCTALVEFGGLKQSISFPYPVDATRSKTRVARKSSYIEVSVPVSGPRSGGGFSSKKFPVMHINGRPANWNIHYFNIDRLPALAIANPPSLSWLTTHLGLIFSDRECVTRLKPTHSGEDWLVDLKESIEHLIGQYTGIMPPQRRLLLAVKSPAGKLAVVIFPTDLRLDLASHTVVMDSCVLPATTENDKVLETWFRRYNFPVSAMNTSPGEFSAWCELLPAFVERCRTWRHKGNCSYKARGIPLTADMRSSPLCSCAAGNPSEEFLKNSQWRSLAGYVTRAAISPLFAVSYLEAVGYARLQDMRASKDLDSGLGEEGEKGFVIGEEEEEEENVVDMNKCRGCRAGGKLMDCGRCRKVRYCSAVCQKADWKRHKVVCRP